MRIRALFTACAALALAAPAAAEAPLRAYAWSARPLILFADGADDAPLREQRAILANHRAALAERAVPVIEVAAGVVAIDGTPSPLSAARLRDAYDVPRGGFRVLLVGKDQGVKLNRSRPVATDDLFALIDAMPMRRREMRERAE